MAAAWPELTPQQGERPNRTRLRSPAACVQPAAGLAALPQATAFTVAPHLSHARCARQGLRVDERRQPTSAARRWLRRLAVQSPCPALCHEDLGCSVFRGLPGHGGGLMDRALAALCWRHLLRTPVAQRGRSRSTSLQVPKPRSRCHPAPVRPSLLGVGSSGER